MYVHWRLGPHVISLLIFHPVTAIVTQCYIKVEQHSSQDKAHLNVGQAVCNRERLDTPREFGWDDSRSANTTPLAQVKRLEYFSLVACKPRIAQEALWTEARGVREVSRVAV